MWEAAKRREQALWVDRGRRVACDRGASGETGGEENVDLEDLTTSYKNFSPPLQRGSKREEGWGLGCILLLS